MWYQHDIRLHCGGAVCAAGMCRAQGIAHQKVTAVQELAGALHAAWALKRHSVLEVITARDSNVDQHRQLQAAVQQAVRQAATLLMPAAPGTPRVIASKQFTA